MKRRLRFLAALVFLLTPLSINVWADTVEGSDETPEPKPINIRERTLESRINALERRISQLEGEIRFLEEKTRNLDRRVDDLRYRHV